MKKSEQPLLKPLNERITETLDRYNLPLDLLEDCLTVGGDDAVSDYYGYPKVQARLLVAKLGRESPPPEQIPIGQRNPASLAIALTRR